MTFLDRCKTHNGRKAIDEFTMDGITWYRHIYDSEAAMDYFDYRVSLLVQTICRSRIRTHQGLPIKVYFSSDINYEMAYAAQEYFKANSPATCTIGGLIKPCRTLSKPDKGNLYDITRLYAYDPLIRRAVESGTTYSFSIPHSTLFRLVPKDKRSSDRYSGLRRFKLLPVICPSGTFASRTDSDLIDYSGILCLDLDDTLDIPGMKALTKTYPYTLAAMVSPTGTGVKIFVLTDLKDPSRHADLYHHLGDIMGIKARFDLKFDPSCSNTSRACFFSYDPKMYINAEAIPFHVDLATLPVYTPPAKTSPAPVATAEIRSDIAFDDIDFPDQLSDTTMIRNAIKESHTLFETTHPMFQGVRNTNLFTLAFFFRLDGVPFDVAADYLAAYYVDPAGGFSADEIRRTVKSAYTR